MMQAAPAIDTAEAFGRLLCDPATPPALLKSVQAPAAVWREVLKRYPHAATWVAANRHLPADIVVELVQHPSPQVRAALATNVREPADVLMQLAHDKSELIRLRVVCNAGATREVLMALAADPCQVVSTHAQARLVHDISGIALPTSYLDDVSMLDILH